MVPQIVLGGKLGGRRTSSMWRALAHKIKTRSVARIASESRAHGSRIIMSSWMLDVLRKDARMCKHISSAIAGASRHGQ